MSPKRNDPCPCRSGRKYKKCCFLKEPRISPAAPLPVGTHAVVEARVRKEKARQERFGWIRPVISEDFRGHKFVAVGSELHWSAEWKTFPDFLQDYIRRVLGPDWLQAESAKPLEKRHEIMKWLGAMRRFQEKQAIGPDGLCGVIPSGAMRAYLLLSYDLYSLRHHSALQESIVRRLKHPDQFQGARHELFVTATCIRAGYEIFFEDETDSSRKHTEFTAAHRFTGQEIAVEAKSRHRPGVMGRRGEQESDDEIRAGISWLLRKAFRKPVSHPYVVFLDLNLPHSAGPLTRASLVNEIAESIDRVAREQGHHDCFNLIVFSNWPDHYVGPDETAPPGDVLSVLSQKPKIVASHPAAIASIDSAARQHGRIPNTFEEASSESRT